MGRTHEATTELVVAARTEEALGVVSLTLRRPGGGMLPPWEPGAHIDLVLEPDLVRQYSLCGDPADPDAWRIAVLREPAGRGGSARVQDSLAVGSRVAVRGPRNHFALEPAERYLFVAGGIGITPILPMIRAAEAAGARWRLLYGGRTRASMAFLDRLDAYGERVHVAPQDETGLLDVAPHLDAAGPDALVYCCGPEPLLAAVEKLCAGRQSGALRVERFGAVGAPAVAEASPEDGGSFDVVLARSGLSLTVPPGTTVLEAVEQAGVDVLSSCREGTCGTCETDVVEGEPDHRDALLTEEERAEGASMMICVSRCRGPRLVLDL
ncbi:PDR/VanB family oxidoreductase [Streptomyces meridianus]|uniref:PDR/VanB family oxidoreductase n=1 Tax=Streptomyces meridianus TaxID=2938945 RepID=A0ABT0XBU7_9ACTN|nr:PDR/VanB family oxidoreductase [Streptomyces meridianus]MCM2580000.1 PDR/VanB family oxidoreductase [Streptomyces meridianus]